MYWLRDVNSLTMPTGCLLDKEVAETTDKLGSADDLIGILRGKRITIARLP